MSTTSNSKNVGNTQSHQSIPSVRFLACSIVGADSSPVSNAVLDPFTPVSQSTSLNLLSSISSLSSQPSTSHSNVDILLDPTWSAAATRLSLTHDQNQTTVSSNPFLSGVLSSSSIYSTRQPNNLVYPDASMESSLVSVTPSNWSTGISSSTSFKNGYSKQLAHANFPSPSSFPPLWTTSLSVTNPSSHSVNNFLPIKTEKTLFSEDFKKSYASEFPARLSHPLQWFIPSTPQMRCLESNKSSVDNSSSVTSHVPPKKRHFSTGNSQMPLPEDSSKKIRLMEGVLAKLPNQHPGGPSPVHSGAVNGHYIAHLAAPLHYYRRGGKVRLYQESLLSFCTKTVEELTLQDFLYSAAISHQRLIFLRVLEIILTSGTTMPKNVLTLKSCTKGKDEGGVLLRFMDTVSGEKAELQLSHPSSPLFTWELGWCSCDPLQTLSLLDVPCSLLQIGLTCLSILEISGSNNA